jgi:hypothetical protein
MALDGVTGMASFSECPEITILRALLLHRRDQTGLDDKASAAARSVQWSRAGLPLGSTPDALHKLGG